MVKTKDLNLEDVCNIAFGFDNDYNAVKYLIEKDGKESTSVSPKEFGKYLNKLKEIVRLIDPDCYKSKLEILRNDLSIQWKKENEFYKKRSIEYNIDLYNKEINDMKGKKIQKPVSITYKGKSYDIDYDIKYQNWWLHAIYQNTASKKKEGDNINPISLALACFMSNKINGSIKTKDIAELEEGLLLETNGINLYHAGFFLLKPQTIFKKLLYKISRIL